MDKLNFCTAGIPIAAKGKGTPDGLRKVADLGLDGMELEFVRGVNMGQDLAEESGKVAKELGLVLTAHAPYYINLNAKEKPKWHASINRIVKTAERASQAGAYSITYHPGYYLKQEPKKVFAKIREAMEVVFEKLDEKGINIWVRPETTGKPTQFGSLQELIQMSQDFERMMPCVDFAHLHARSGGEYNSTEEFREVMELIESGLGREGLREMHLHLSGINYSEKGERNHLILEESDMRYRELLAVLKEFKARGVLVCESPNIEQDALLLKKTFSSQATS